MGSHIPARQSQSHGDKAPELTLQHWRFQHFLVKKKIWCKNAMSNYLQIWLIKIQKLVAALGIHERLSPASSNPSGWSSRVELRGFQTRAGTVLPLVPSPFLSTLDYFWASLHRVGLLFFHERAGKKESNVPDIYKNVQTCRGPETTGNPSWGTQEALSYLFTLLSWICSPMAFFYVSMRKVTWWMTAKEVAWCSCFI